MASEHDEQFGQEASAPANGLAPDDLALTQPFLFYRLNGLEPRREIALPQGYRYEVWRPRLTAMIPAGIAHLRSRFIFRWTLHQLRIFSNREYQVVVIRELISGKAAHYSGATGGYWRWPFMTPQDMQIGDTWTHPEHRGRKLASAALSILSGDLARHDRMIWYVTELENPASIAVASGVGMRLVGRGVRVKPRYLRGLDTYQIRSTVEDPARSSNQVR